MENKERHERINDNNELIVDNCCGTTFDKNGNESLRCIGGGHASWVGKDWQPGDRPTKSLRICQCRRMSMAEYRQMWVSKYLGNSSDCVPDSKVLMAYQEYRSMYFKSDAPNATAIKLAAMIAKEISPLSVTHYFETINSIGDRYENGMYMLPIGGYWIILDADMPEPTERACEHYNKLISGAHYNNFGIAISSKLSWQEYAKKYNIINKLYDVK